MRALLAVVVLSVATAGCFGGFEQPPQTAKKKTPIPSQPDGGVDKDASAGSQSYTEAWAIICEAEQQAGLDASLSRAERGAKVANWIVANLKNKKARYWFIGFGKVKKNRREVFLKEAKKGGQDDCALAAFLFDQSHRP